MTRSLSLLLQLPLLLLVLFLAGGTVVSPLVVQSDDVAERDVDVEEQLVEDEDGLRSLVRGQLAAAHHLARAQACTPPTLRCGDRCHAPEGWRRPRRC